MTTHSADVSQLAVLAREFRNPLEAIQNAVCALRARGGTDSARDDAFTLIARQSSHLMRLVDDLSSLNRLTTGTLELRKRRVDIESVVSIAAESCAPSIGAYDGQLEVRLPERKVFVYADPARLTQVVVNLLDNAAKYSAPCGQIVLSVAQDRGQAMIRVQDDGIGIAPEKLQRVFDLFVQVGLTLTGTKHGMGVGLHLVKHIVELHDGRVEVHSEGIGHGSVFTVCIPEHGPIPKYDAARA